MTCLLAHSQPLHGALPLSRSTPLPVPTLSSSHAPAAGPYSSRVKSCEQLQLQAAAVASDSMVPCSVPFQSCIQVLIPEFFGGGCFAFSGPNLTTAEPHLAALSPPPGNISLDQTPSPACLCAGRAAEHTLPLHLPWAPGTALLMLHDHNVLGQDPLQEPLPLSACCLLSTPLQ